MEPTKIALITGANRGLGLATARGLAAAGVTTIVGARDADDGAAAAAAIGGDASTVVLDVTSDASVAAAVAVIGDRHGRLDILVNNAGVLLDLPAEGREVVDVGLFAATYAVNLMGPVRVLEAFLPLLRLSPAGRVVNVSSRMGSMHDQQDPASPYVGMAVPAYQSSKAALNGVSVAVAKALADTSITLTSVCPGFAQTELTAINREQAPLTADEAAETVVAASLRPGEAGVAAFTDRDGPVPW
jgi:NAD(P)-dependent dehydrogenase (short-subunit alcohol dehydrogenase family)